MIHPSPFVFTSYAKIHIPIIASVSEHQPTTWVSFFFDLHILVCTFPAGLWFCIKNINDERVFGKTPLRRRKTSAVKAGIPHEWAWPCWNHCF